MDGRKQVVDRYLHSLLRHHCYPAKILVDHVKALPKIYSHRKEKVDREKEINYLESRSK